MSRGVAARVAAWRSGHRGLPGSTVASGGAAAQVTFPSTPLVSRAQVALGADLSADPLTWAWADITGKVRWDLGVSLTAGRRDESSTVAAGSGRLKLDNRDGRFTRRNPTSPYYGLLSKNTPIWITVDAGSGEKTRMEMFVNEWPKAWADKSANDSTVAIQCAGVLRRLAQGSVLKSALRRAVLSRAEPSPFAYWPCEDASGSTAMASGLSSGQAISNSALRFASSGIAGSGGALDLVAIGDLVSFTTPGLPTAGGFQVEFAAASDLGTDTYFLSVGVASQNQPIGLSSAFATGDPHHLAVRFYQNGANVDADLYRDGVFSSTTTSLFTGVTLTAGTPVNLYIRGDLAGPTGTVLMAHLAVYGNDVLDVPLTRALAADGYAGDQAHERLTRLCAEEGVVFQATAGRSAAMGPQGTKTLLSLLRECEAADGGTLYEKRWGLAYQSLDERYNQPVGLPLDIGQYQLAELPDTQDDDQRTRNQWTVSRTDGSEYTAEQTTGPMGTGTDGPGLYDDSVTLNLETDDQLPDQANWRLHVSTVDEDRWPDLGLNFAHDPDLIDTWCSLGYGARTTLANPLAQMPPDPPDLIIEGHSERWNSKQWTASLNCSPASPYRVNVVASTDGNLGRVDAANSTLAADATDVATTISVASPSALWVTGTVNFDIAVAGERMTVTNISGGSSPQTFTVTRSINNVVKAQPASFAGRSVKVSLWQPAAVAL